MRPARELLTDLFARKEHLEENWSLPNSDAEGADGIWKDPLVRELYSYDRAAVDPILGGLLEHDSFALIGVGLHGVARHARTDFNERVRDLLFHSAVPVRSLAILTLGRVGRTEDIDEIYEIRDDEHGDVKTCAVRVLESHLDPRAIPLLGRWLGRTIEEESVRLAACRALGTFADGAAVPILMRALQDETAPTALREAAVSAMGRIPSDDAARILLKRAELGDPVICRPCLIAVLKREDKKFESHVLSLATHRRPLVREAALLSLADYDGKRGLALAKSMRHDSIDSVRLASLHVLLQNSPSPQAIRVAYEFLEDPATVIRLAALRFLQRLSGVDLGIPQTEVPSLERLDRAVGLARSWILRSEES